MTPAEINAHLLGADTDPFAFGMYVIAILIAAVVIWGITTLLIDRKSDPALWGGQIHRKLTWAMLIAGVLACMYGAILIFKIKEILE
jgi:hypothetical protein